MLDRNYAVATLRRAMLALALVAGAAACTADSTGPDPDDVVGTYEATRILAIIGEDTADAIATGGFISLTLEEGGDTFGQLFIPDGISPGLDIDEDLTGTWDIENDAVWLTHDGADTFLQSLPFTVRSGGRLVADRTQQNGVRFVVHLERVD